MNQEQSRSLTAEGSQGGALRRARRWMIVATLTVLFIVGWMAWRHWEDGRWEDRAITAQFAEVTVQRQNDKDVHVLLRYNLTNATRRTYRLAMPPLGEMEQQLPDGDFHEVDSVIWDPVVIRAGKTASVEFDLTLPATRDLTSAEEIHKEQDLKAFADRELSQMRDLVFFDYGNRYSIDLPKGWP